MNTLETATQRTTNPLPLLAHLGDRLLHLVAPVTLVVVPGATPHLLVMCATHKRPKPSMSGHLAASAPAPPAVLSIGRHALHITSPCIDRHRCAEATDAAAPLARASLFCGLLAKRSLPLLLHVATTPAVPDMPVPTMPVPAFLNATTARVLNAFLPTVHVGTLHSLPATAVWAAHGAPHATTRTVVTFWFGVHACSTHASADVTTEIAAAALCLDQLFTVVFALGALALGALLFFDGSTTRVLEALLPMEHVGLLHSLPATAECAAHGAPHVKATTVVTFWFGVHDFWFALLAVACGATVLHHTTTPTELPCGRTTSALCLGDFDRGDLIVPGRAT